MRSKTLCIAAAALPTAAAEARISCVLTDFLLGSLDILMMDVGLYSSGLHFWLNLWYTTKRDAGSSAPRSITAAVIAALRRRYGAECVEHEEIFY